MGKSNKFDYTNRTNAGLPLGQIMGKALRDQAQKVKADAERLLRKARKQSINSVGGASDIDNTKHTIDLKAPNKDLKDDAICALAEGLEDALRSGDDTASLALEDLNLSGNSITTVALARLAPTIELARYDLKTLDLSGNKIKVVTDEEAAQWETFLRAFHHCFRLRRLDLSNNPQLGSRALEILARLHTSESRIEPVNLGGDTSVHSLTSNENVDENDTSTGASFQWGEEKGRDDSHMTRGRILKRRCGLRSLPYLTLHDIGLDDAGALWLSYVLQDHHYPDQLMDEVNGAHAGSTVRLYQQRTTSRGIDWSGNDSVGKDGLQLLENTEALRHLIMYNDTARTGALSLLHERRPLPMDEASEWQPVSRTVPGDRRVSIRSIVSDDGAEKKATDLQSARWRMQRQILAHNGVKSVELWKAALKVLWASRILLFTAPIISPCSNRQLSLDDRIEEDPDMNTAPRTDSPTSTSPSQLKVNTARASDSPAKARPSYASKLAVVPAYEAREELAITDATNTPTTPLKLQRPSARKSGLSEGTDIELVSKKLNGIAVHEDGPERFLRFQQKRVRDERAKGRFFWDLDASWDLPADVMERVTCFTMAKRERNVLSAAHKRDAVARGQDRGTLEEEKEWRRKDRSAQEWLLLDSIDCLSYGE